MYKPVECMVLYNRMRMRNWSIVILRLQTWLLVARRVSITTHVHEHNVTDAWDVTLIVVHHPLCMEPRHHAKDAFKHKDAWMHDLCCHSGSALWTTKDGYDVLVFFSFYEFNMSNTATASSNRIWGIRTRTYRSTWKEMACVQQEVPADVSRVSTSENALNQTGVRMRACMCMHSAFTCLKQEVHGKICAITSTINCSDSYKRWTFQICTITA